MITLFYSQWHDMTRYTEITATRFSSVEVPQDTTDPVALLLRAAKDAENAAYSLAGRTEAASVAALILLSSQLETQALRIKKTLAPAEDANATPTHAEQTHTLADAVDRQ